MSKSYAVIDIETTGGRAARDRITEIAIVLYDGEQIIDRWESLINPECYIPQGIVELTGITQEMVRDAPKFYEVARKVVEMTENAVFVAHNVRFDYSFICEEFKRLGYTYTRKQLCTVRLSRQAFPGLPSYSLGKLAASLGVPLENRHRAMGDAQATASILDLILQKDDNREEAQLMINLGLKESRLPQNFSLEKIHQLPESCGVYYFHDENGDVVYVGKSINIRKRIAEHFADRTSKASRLQQLVHDVTYEPTGSELVALLLESHEIKRLNPQVNRAQRQRSYPYVIHSWTNEQGYLCFAMDRMSLKERKGLQIVSEYAQQNHARNHLHSIRERFGLCAHLCGESKTNTACFFYHLRQCQGACIGAEPPESYNVRAAEAQQLLSTVFDDDFYVLDIGRDPGELSVILVERGLYRGFGYLSKEGFSGRPDEVRDAIKYVPGNPETNRIIHRYINQNKVLGVAPLKPALQE